MSLCKLVFPKENVEILDMIQKYNVNINEPVLHRSGDTYLHIAASNKDIFTLNFLLKNGAKRSINVKNNIGQTPLHIATENGSGEIVKLLLENGANYTIRDFKDQDDLYLFS